MVENTSVPEPNSEINKLVYVIRDDGSYGGWRTELLVEEITGKGEGKFLLCSYCRGVLRDACLFEKDGKQELRCSVCVPTDINKQTVQLNRETVNEKQVNCPLKGCDWTNELSELLHHLEECELFPVACPLGCRDKRGEVSRVERRGVETHRTCCPMRTVKCVYCSVSVKACDMNGHLEVCEEFPIPCPNKCSEEFRMKRKDKSIHLSQECPLQETECPYSQYGCEVKVQRRNLEQHEKEDMHKHLKCSMYSMQRIIFELKNENEVLRKLIPRGSLEWKISGIRNKISGNEDTFSDPFYVGLYKFQCYVKWVNTHNENYIGLYRCVMKGEWDDTLEWPIKYKSSMVLINQIDANDNYETNNEISEEVLEKFQHCLKKPSAERNPGFGQREFISYAGLLQDEYSKDDLITLKISIEQILSRN